MTLDEFLQTLAKYEWYISRDGEIRSDILGVTCCPLTRRFLMGGPDYVTCAAKLGIEYDQAVCIAYAADNLPGFEELRVKLLKACNLTKE